MFLFKKHDLHNFSYTNSRSGQGALGRRDSIILDVSESPKALDLFPKEKGGGAECREVLPSPSHTFMHDVPPQDFCQAFQGATFYTSEFFYLTIF